MNSACRLPLFSSDDLDLPVAWRDEGGRAVSRSRRRLLAEAALRGGPVVRLHAAATQRLVSDPDSGFDAALAEAKRVLALGS